MKKTFTLTFLFLGVLCANHLIAQESKFKALFIYKFAEYVEWNNPPANLTVGIMDDKDVYKELSNFASSKGGIKVIKISSSSQASTCHMVFIPKSKDEEISSVKSAVNGKSILVVSDNSSLITEGADIGFFLESGKLRFKINKKSIESKKMIPSSKLLALGQSIN